jgi:EAL and modified HD-GYP domain-containing signal transduction protein
MSTNVDLRTTALLARQPILEESGEVFGYELLYRVDAEDTGGSEDVDDLASARVLADAVVSLGLDALTGGRPAFIKFTRALLVGDAWALLPPGVMTVELGSEVEADEHVLDACRRLRERECALCLDNFTLSANARLLLPFATSVKMDFRGSPAEAPAVIHAAASLGIPAIATHVDTPELSAAALAAGFRLFQGSAYCQPRTFEANALPARKLAYLNLLGALNRENLGVAELEELVKHDLSLSYRVLRLVNSAGYGTRGEVTSIRHALLLIGREVIRRWASVWAMAGLNNGGTPETVTVALLRARSCELVGAEMDKAEHGDGLFLLGLCSLLDVIVGRPMDQALEEMPIDAGIKAALLGSHNEARTVLDAVIAYEQGRWDDAEAALVSLGLGGGIEMQDIYSDALRWARELVRP